MFLSKSLILSSSILFSKLSQLLYKHDILLIEIIGLEDTGLEGTSEELVHIVDASWALSLKEFVGT